MLGKAGFAAIAVISAAVGASSLDPRELYNEMYPVEVVKRDAFRICHEADPTFVRAVRVDREACFDAMPHAIAVALGRVRPTAALAVAALLDPSRQAELLLTLAAMPPQQPITVPRSFANTAWMRALSPAGCGDKTAAGSSSDRGAAPLDRTIRGNLPPLPRAVRAGIKEEALPVIPLVAGSAPEASGGGDPPALAASEPAVVDLGDRGPPAVVPLAPDRGCGGGA